jgi:crotonobetainyl-CoA:carnitine CoA-transferase CaiB-like acyl-CoA transferase
MLLAGLKVIEYATYIAAPGAGGLMADWGADVIKIEPPGGDPIRRFFDTIGSDIAENPVFDLDNRGKRSIIIDTAHEEGRDLVRKLVAEADVFITNVRPGGLTRAGLDYAALSAVNPRLIYANVTGYGLEGPDVDRAGFDVAAFWSRSGWARLTAPKGVEPFPIRTGVGDHICSLSTVAGILAALHGRHSSGKGQHVDAANFFQCRDGRWLTLLPRQGTADWPGFCQALSLDDLQHDPRFATSKARRENGPTLVALMDEVFASRDFADIATRLDSHDLVWAPVQSPAETVADPQFLAAGGMTQIEDGQGGSKASPSGPIRFPGIQESTKRPVPTPGKDARPVLAEAGFSAEEIEGLLAKATVAERL